MTPYDPSNIPITDASSNASIFIDVSCLVSQNKLTIFQNGSHL